VSYFDATILVTNYVIDKASTPDTLKFSIDVIKGQMSLHERSLLLYVVICTPKYRNVLVPLITHNFWDEPDDDNLYPYRAELITAALALS